MYPTWCWLKVYGHTAITYSYTPHSILFTDTNRSVEHSEINSVWWRLKPNVRRIPNNIDEMRTETFINREWQMSLEPLSFFLKSCLWINKRSSDYLIRNKPYQLYLATAYGFSIPETVISNNVYFILEKSKHFKEKLYKPLGYLISPPNKLLFANKITREEIESSRENIILAPGIFQNYIDKDFELRITVINSFVLAVKIYSQ